MARRSAAKKASTKKAVLPNELNFDFIKSNYFRVIHVDGAFGGLSANGNIHMALYNERRPIPRMMVNKIEGSSLGPEIREKREERTGLVREVEIDAVMSIDQAKALHTWLAEKIETHNKLFADSATSDPAKAKKRPRKSGNGKAK